MDGSLKSEIDLKMKLQRLSHPILTIAFFIVGILLVNFNPTEPQVDGKSFTRLLRDLNNSDPVLRDKAEIGLRSIGSKATPFLLERLNYEDPEWIRSLHGYLQNIEIGDKWLEKSMAQEKEYLAIQAFEVLGELASNAVPSLFDQVMDLNGSHPQQRLSAVFALGRIGEKGLDALIWSIENDPNQKVQQAAIIEVGTLGPVAARATSALRSVLESRNWHLRWAAVESLGQIGPSASSAVTDLEELVTQTRYEQERQHCQASLAKINIKNA